MVTITPDPANPDRLCLTATVSVYLDKVLLQTLNEEVEKAIVQQAREDFNKKTVQKELARLTTEYLAKLLGVDNKEQK